MSERLVMSDPDVDEAALLGRIAEFERVKAALVAGKALMTATRRATSRSLVRLRRGP
ncbi:hypothetical protein [Mycolicibacterium llatzerense]|uniref:hypothetical protein n=1 Tax=Mycolicibacterium llatzerense TaxID=280871 RepID=UPI0021B57960|nr:hypothetical protein [Mycolicibacterium llatzerense]